MRITYPEENSSWMQTQVHLYPILPMKETKFMQQSQQAGRLVDLSHTIEEGLVTYKGLPAPIICDFLSREDSRQQYAAGTEFQIGKMELVGNTGTYIDCPFHRYADGKDISEVDLTSFAELEGIVVRVPFAESRAITPEHFKNKVLKDRAVLVHTGWACHWNTECYYEQHPYLTEEAAVFLKEAGVKLVGIDSHNIDNTATHSRPVHSILLAAEILIVEHLCNLENLPEEGFYFNAIPPKIKGMGTFPVRAFAKVVD
jgi:kynurenine formamidase